jgi:AcrR family transcriptional regulator
MRPKTSDQRGPAEHARRDQIIAAATDHFRQYGYDKTTVGDLAKAIGFSTAYVYKFFGSKQAIGDAVCSICLSRIAADFQAIADRDAAPSERIREIFLVLSRHARELSLRDTRLQDMVLAAHREPWRCFEKHKAALRGVIMRVVEEGRLSGEFERKTPIDETCRSILLVMEPFWNPTLWAQKLDQLDEQAASLAALALRSMAS